MRIFSSTAIATLLLGISLEAGPKVLARNNADGYLVDAAHILSPVDDSQLNLKLLAYKERSGNQFAVVIVPDLGDSTIQEYANTLFHEWGIGVKGQDNGVLLLWTIKERKVRLEVGRGLEESLPDGRAGIIIRDNILPNFKAQSWRAGVEQGVDAVIAQLDYKPVAAPVKAVAPSTPASLDVYFVMGFLAFGLAIAAFFVWYSKEEDPPPHLTPDESPTRSTYSDFSPRPSSQLPRNTAPRVIPAAVAPLRRRMEPAPRKREDAPSTYIPIPIPVPYDSGSSSSSSSSSFGSDSGSSFGGGDSGGGGADGGY